MNETGTQQNFQQIFAHCISLFGKKMKDYNAAWRVLRASSLTDQILIKAKRIRSVQMKEVNMVGESIEDEFVGIINYAAMAIIQLRLGVAESADLDFDKANRIFSDVLQEAARLMEKKNHDYGEAWRSMRVSSITDIILMKLLRIKQIEDNQGNTLVSEGVDANYFDIINYAVFSLILLGFNP
ncbi:MAG: DUF1599 domain-containing protein [Bacteroidales bacterium]|nr:DUF1599 domain-containing protein [Bacteroidales bacterium]